MSERINKDKLLDNIHNLLSTAGITEGNQTKYFNQMLNDTLFDMNLKMDIMEYSVKFFMYERGQIVFEKHLTDEQTIIYIVLENIVSIHSTCTAKRSVLPNGFIDLSDEKRIKDEAFAKIGEPYLTMYQNKLNVFSC